MDKGDYTFPLIDKEEIGEQLRYLMRRKHLKPSDVQEYLGLTCVQTVYRWLEGVNIPSVDHLYALSQLFHVRVDDMLAGNRRIQPEDAWQKHDMRLMKYYIKSKKTSECA